MSGHFAPIHNGHLEYFDAAWNYCWETTRTGDNSRIDMIAIVNNDEQVKLKGSIPFADEDMRYEIVDALEIIDRAFIRITSYNVCYTKLLRPFNYGV